MAWVLRSPGIIAKHTPFNRMAWHGSHVLSRPNFAQPLVPVRWKVFEEFVLMGCSSSELLVRCFRPVDDVGHIVAETNPNLLDVDSCLQNPLWHSPDREDRGKVSSTCFSDYEPLTLATIPPIACPETWGRKGGGGSLQRD